jgi:hypothetical protein
MIIHAFMYSSMRRLVVLSLLCRTPTPLSISLGHFDLILAPGRFF